MRRILSKSAASVATAALAAVGSSSTVAASSSCSLMMTSAAPQRLSTAPLLAQQYRYASTYESSSSSSSSLANSNAMTESEEGAEQGQQHDGEHDALSTEVGEEDDFDYVEASCQEIHDIAHSMYIHLSHLGGPRSNWDQRGNVRARRPAQISGVHYKYRTVEEAVEGQKRFTEDYDRLLQHLSVDTWSRLMTSAHKESHNRRQASNKAKFNRADIIPIKAWLLSNDHTYYSNAPHEVLQLRTDIPSHLVENARAVRDQQTMNWLKVLTKRSSEYRIPLTMRLLELTEKAPAVDPTHNTRTSGISKAFGDE